MNRILDQRNRAVLESFFGADAVLVFDYDGTLAPIAPTPGEAQMRPRTRELLDRVARRYPVVIVTGRARHDVLQFLHGIPLLEVIGNHGFEISGVPPPLVLRRVQHWHKQLERDLGALPGILIEDKRYSLAVHYRACADPAAAAAAVRRSAEALDGVRLVGGKAVLNVVLREAPDKGAAIDRLRARLGDPAIVVVGDDETDEDAFVRAQGTRYLGIRVGDDSESAAPYCLRDQTEIDDLLTEFAQGARQRAAAT